PSSPRSSERAPRPPTRCTADAFRCTPLPFRPPLGHTTAMTRRRMAWWSAALFWFLFGLITGIQVWLSMLSHHHSVPRLIGYYVLVWEAWLIPTAAIFWLTRRRANFFVHF